MKILNVNGKPIPACAVISYRGFEISVSTIFSPPALAVFLDGFDMARAFFGDESPSPSAENIRKAMEGIDKAITKAEANIAAIDNVGTTSLRLMDKFSETYKKLAE